MKSHRISQGINEYKFVKFGIMKQIELACILLVAGAHIPYLTKSATQFESAPVGRWITMPGSCWT
mgnify:FL=1